MMTEEDITENMTRMRNELIALHTQIAEQRGPLAQKLEEMDATLLSLTHAIAALSDDDDDASAGLRQPGALSGRVSPALREQMNQMRQAPNDELVADLLQTYNGPRSRGDIQRGLKERGYERGGSAVKRALDALIEEGVVGTTGTGPGTMYYWSDGSTPGGKRNLTTDERELLSARLEHLIRSEPRNATQLHEAAQEAGLESRKGTVDATLRTWREEGKVEMVELQPGSKASSVWQWIEDASGEDGAGEAVSASAH